MRHYANARAIAGSKVITTSNIKHKINKGGSNEGTKWTDERNAPPGKGTTQGKRDD